jgi:succinate-semialdehyde dehydrogenase/glutarate-semialdehyde dehydrogenase
MDLISGLNDNKMYIGGEWIKSPTNKKFEVKNPADFEQVSGSYHYGNQETTTQALQAADRIQNSWENTPARDRSRLLTKIYHLLMEHRDELAKILVMEHGKPLKEAQGEINAAASHFEWFAEEGVRLYGRIIPQTNAGKRSLVLRKPIGVCATVSPWNFPFVLWARKVAPALAAGCAVVARTASQTTLTAMAAMKLIATVGLPAGALNLVTGPASELMNVFLESDLCKKISFTGSTPVGRTIMRKGADNIKHLSLELGGNAPGIVFEDADIDLAVKCVLGAKYRNNGQSCIAINRIYVHEKRYEEFTKRFISGVQKLKQGNGLTPGIDVGPMVDEDSMNHCLSIIDDAVKNGAKLEFGGQRAMEGELKKGYFITPTVLTNVSEDMRCMREEIFGPVAPISPFKTLDEVIEKANNTEYGLSAYVYTTSLRNAFLASEKIEAGTIGVNDDVPSTTIAPFGGFKQSGFNRECGREGLEAFTEVKHIAMVL